MPESEAEVKSKIGLKSLLGMLAVVISGLGVFATIVIKLDDVSDLEKDFDEHKLVAREEAASQDTKIDKLIAETYGLRGSINQNKQQNTHLMNTMLKVHEKDSGVIFPYSRPSTNR